MLFCRKCFVVFASGWRVLRGIYLHKPKGMEVVVRQVWSSVWEHSRERLLLVTDVSTTWAEVIFGQSRVKKVFVSWQCLSLQLLIWLVHSFVMWLVDKIHRFSWVQTILKLKISPSPVKIVVLIRKTPSYKFERFVSWYITVVNKPLRDGNYYIVSLEIRMISI